MWNVVHDYKMKILIKAPNKLLADNAYKFKCGTESIQVKKIRTFVFTERDDRKSIYFVDIISCYSLVKRFAIA